MEGRVLQFLYPRNTKNMTESVQVTISDGEDLTGFVLEITVVEVPAFHPTWNVSDPRVIIDPRTGNWTVSVKGGEGQEIWVVIPGVGSFRMEEVSPGEYSVTIPGSEFKDGEVYSYHFSDRDGGPDLAPGLGGSMTQPDLDEDDRPSLLWLYLVIALVLVVLILAGFFAYGFIRKDRNLAYDDDVWEE